jgi:hypothetical protein
VVGIWQYRSYQGRVTGRLFLVQDGNIVRGEVLESSMGARGELEGVVDGRRLSLRRRFAFNGTPRQQELTLIVERGGTRLEGTISDRAGGGGDFDAQRLFPAPDPGPGPGPRGPVVIAPPPPPPPSAVPEERLRQLMGGIDAESFNDGKMGVLRQAAAYDFYDIAQVVRVLGLFPFDDGKLAALTIMRPRILDPQNGLRVPELFSFNSSKDKARAILAPR